MCILAATLTLALTTVAFAEEDDGVVTGTVVSVTKDGDFKIDQSKFEFTRAYDDASTLKVGEKVRVYYYHCGSGRKGFHHCTKKIEKLGNADGARKE